jgi:tripartite-type tricarboxylate transporter receptor subunit TctC
LGKPPVIEIMRHEETMSSFVRPSVFCLSMLFAIAVHAQNYPTKPLLVVLPVQSASAGDVMVRVVAQKMSENMRQQFVIVNLPGAAGLIGAERVAHAAPDGYTIGGLADGLLTQIPYLYQEVPYDPVKSFEPVSLVASVGYVLIVHPSMAASSLKEFIAHVKAQPGKIDFASGGNGNPQHLAMALFMSATGTSLNHVPYRGATQAALDVIGGRIPVMFAAIAVTLPSIRDGRLRPLAVPSEKRSSLLAEVPTFAEAGMPGFVFSASTAFHVPQGTPRAIVELLSSETIKALSEPAVRERLAAAGLEPGGTTPDQLGAMIRNDRARMAKIIREAGIKIDQNR